jgi:hypothetical protein
VLAGGVRTGLFAIPVLVDAGAGLAVVAFTDLIYFFTWLATGHDEFGRQGYAGSSHLPWLGLGFFVIIPVIGGLIYGPPIYRWAVIRRGRRPVVDGGQCAWSCSAASSPAKSSPHGPHARRCAAMPGYRCSADSPPAVSSA